MPKTLTALFLLTLLLLQAGCTGGKAPTAAPSPPAQRAEEAPQPEEPPLLTEACRFCGREIPEGTALDRPLLVILDNTAPARPQAGLQEACLVYEVSVEGGLTRLLALFGHRFTGDIGPVRSARPYFAMLTVEHGGILGHCGFSPRGEAVLKELGVAHINEIAQSQYYFRSSLRKAPYNLYTSVELLQKGGEKLKFLPSGRKDPVFKPGHPVPMDGQAAGSVRIAHSNLARADYLFHPDSGLYLRSFNGQPHLDTQGIQLAAGSIIVQFVTQRPEEPGSERLDIKLTGEGKGYYFTGGTALPLVWSKKDAFSPTRYTVEGKELTLAPGTTWIHLVSMGAGSSVTFE